MKKITVNQALRGIDKLIRETQERLTDAIENEHWRDVTHLSAYLSGLEQAKAVFEQVES